MSGRHIPFANTSFEKIALFLLFFAVGASGSRASLLDLPDTPLFLGLQVPPNVFLQIDDSGSMLEEVLTRQYWFAFCYDSNAPAWGGDWDCDGSWERSTDGYWHAYSGRDEFFANFGYIFPTRDTIELAYMKEECRDTTPFRRDDDDDWIPRIMLTCGDAFDPAVNPPYRYDWRILSSDFNVLYFNPAQTYRPWNGPCSASGTPCADASFTAARSNPYEGSLGYSDVRDLTGFVYEVWLDDKGYSGDMPRRGADDDGSGPDQAINVTPGPNGEVDLWDSHIRFTVNADHIKMEEITYNPTESGLNPVVTSTLFIRDPVKLQTIKQNIANWYQYHRRRSLTAKAAIAEVLSKRPNIRYGASVINNRRDNPFFVEVPAPSVTDYTAHNANLLNKLLGFQMGNGGTPLRQGLEVVGRYFDNTDGRTDPILPADKGGSCQKNFALLFTDGYWNGDPPSVRDEDGDGISGTLADVAMYYYQKDLSDLPDEVPADAMDPATHQHMVTFGAAFGVYGQLSDSDGDGWPNPPLAASGNWGDPTTDTADMEKIDDLWHAAFNSKGGFFSAATPESLLAGLNKTMEQISGRSNPAAATVALSSGYISSDSRVYQARFNNAQWSGQLLSYPVHADPGKANFGALDTSGDGPEGSEWDAAEKIPDYNRRVVLSYNGSSGHPFRWEALSSTQQTALGSESVLNYLRGDSSEELKNGGTLRNRAGKLGDIINSSPLFVGPPAFRYTFDDYPTFRSKWQERPSMIYVGANDGMLHAFDATTGVERFAYVPSPLYGRLAELSKPAYTHRFFVDATPVMGDARFDGDWHTLLAGGLGKGGQGIYLLDITDPTSYASEPTAAANVLWEFTDRDDADLGYTYGRPAITRMQNGRWAVIFGNGYNNTENDGSVSSSGNAVLYIAFIDAGIDGWSTGDFVKLDTGAGLSSSADGTTPNGLATPIPVDIDGDGRVDYIYAGDLQGNLWKFDVTASSPSGWKVAFGGQPLFRAEDSLGNPQPITVRPEVGRTPYGNGTMVYFGTGKFLESGDVSTTGAQSFYAILDDDDKRVTSRSQLLEQTVLSETGYDSRQVRITSNKRMSSHRGWYLDLPIAGERQISSPVLRGRRIIFTTMRPAGSSCSSGGESWLMVLDAFHGSRLQVSPFDLDKDGDFDEADLVDKTAASGLKIDQISNTPGFATSDDSDFVYLTGDPESEPYALHPGETTGRKSWRQLR